MNARMKGTVNSRPLWERTVRVSNCLRHPSISHLQMYGGHSLYFVLENVSQMPKTTIKASPTIKGMSTSLSVDFL